MLKVEHITKKLGRFKLEDISFEIPKGYICGLIGPNGAGKTTLLHLILGLYQAQEGQIWINGREVRQEERAVKEDIGYVLNEELFEQGSTLAQNGDRFGKYYSGYEKKVLEEYCSRFGLDMNKKLKAFSKGEKLKFQFAFALAHHPKLLILDEPTANFDPEFRQEFLEILSDFVSDGERSVVLATHVTEDLDRLADYITFLYGGKLIFHMSREEMEDSFRLVSGENYKVKLLPEKRLIYRETGKYSSKALVRHGKYSLYDRELSIDRPSIEDVMYYIVKGVESYGKDGVIRLLGE